jgi:hypothetical protein
MNTGVNLPITMHRNAERKWHVVIPSSEAVAAQRKALLAVFGNKAPNAQSHKQLQNPRDTMRTFLEGMATWNEGGRALAMSTMDLSAYPELLRERDGATAAGYLRRVLNRIGLIGLQSIPHDGTAREPYVHFVHNAGAIVISMSLGGGRKSTTEQKAFDSLYSKGVLSLAAGVLAGAPFLLIAAEPDLGTAMVLVPVAWVMLLIAGAPVRLARMT